MRCNTCGRDAGRRKLCPYHKKAYENIVEKYAVWRKSLKISWEEYLKEIGKHSLTGEWSKEVARCLTSNEEVNDGKKV